MKGPEKQKVIQSHWRLKSQQVDGEERIYVTTLPLPINKQIGSVPRVTKVSLNP